MLEKNSQSRKDGLDLLINDINKETLERKLFVLFNIHFLYQELIIPLYIISLCIKNKVNIYYKAYTQASSKLPIENTKNFQFKSELLE